MAVPWLGTPSSESPGQRVAFSGLAVHVGVVPLATFLPSSGGDDGVVGALLGVVHHSSPASPVSIGFDHTTVNCSERLRPARHRDCNECSRTCTFTRFTHTTVRILMCRMCLFELQLGNCSVELKRARDRDCKDC